MTATIGHNKVRVGSIGAEQLRSIIARIEKLEEEKADTAADIRYVLAEAKGNGFDVKAIRQIVKLRKQSNDQVAEEEHILDVCKRALGMLPLFGEEE